MDVSISHSIDASGIGAALPGRDVFMHALSQTARLLNIVTPLPDAALVVETMHGREALSAPYSFEIDCLSSSIHFELKRFIGEEVTLRVLLADGRSHRNWHGLVTAASQLGGDGGLARYRLVIEPWFAYLRPRRNSRIFQDKTAQDIVSEVFADYPTGSFEFALTDALPLRSYTAQYRESDFEFVVRILASEGLSYRFEHRQDGSAATTGAGQSTEELAHTRHKLVIFDAHSALPGCPQSLIRFHRSNATEASDSVQSWQTRQQLMTNTVTRASWDYKQLLSPAGSSRVMTEAFGGLGDFPELEDFHGGSAYRYADASQADRAAAFVTQYLALATQTHRITSSVRQLDAGQQFLIVGHPVLEGERARHTVLAIEHEAANNLDSNAKPLAGLLAGNGDDKPLERGTYRNTALCVVAALPVVPQPQRKPIVPGHHSAIVVGTANDAQGLGTHSDRDGRIKIQFPWQRGTAPIVGGLTHDTERATNDNANSTWVRVAESLAGPNWGSSFTPRVGSEVIVEFIEGDIDRPIVTQQMWNGEDTPPFAAGEGSGANHPGVIAGMHAPTLDGSGWGQWLVDDASGQLRTRLASSHTNSQLNLGYLIHGQGAASSHRGAYRGQGFELATDGWSILRATMGLLITTSPRANGASTQLDTSEAAAQLKAAHDTASRMSAAASQSEADPLAQATQIETFRTTIHEKEAPADGSGTPEREVPGFTAAAILLDSPSSIALTSPASTTVFASEQLTTTAQADTQLTAQHTASLVAGDAASLYTHAGGIKAIAANSPLSIQAHDGPMEILADKSVSVTSSNDSISVLADSKIVVQAGQSSITLEGSNITFACPGNFTVKGGGHNLAAGASAPAALMTLPSGS